MTIAQRIGAVQANIDASTRAREFTSLARVLAASRFDLEKARALVKQHRLPPRLEAILHGTPFRADPNFVSGQRAAIAAGTTTDTTWARPLAEYQVVANAFLESLKSFGAFDAMLPSMRRVPFRSRVGATTTGASGDTVAQASAKIISRLTLTGGTVDELKAVCIIVITEELGRFGEDASAGDLFALELSNAVAVETDETFISILTASVSAVGASGVSAEHVRNDLRAALSRITTNARSRLFLLVPSALAKTLSVMHATTGQAAFPDVTYRGGEVSGIVVVVSDGVPANTAILVDAQQVAAASDAIVLDTSREASVQLESAPDSPPSASVVLTNLWAHNLLGLRATRWFGATKLTTTGVAVVNNIAYVGDSPGP